MLILYRATVFRLVRIPHLPHAIIIIIITPPRTSRYHHSAVASEMAPFRLAHFDTANLGIWASVGYNVSEVAEFLSVSEASLNHPNIAIGLRVKGNVGLW